MGRVAIPSRKTKWRNTVSSSVRTATSSHASTVARTSGNWAVLVSYHFLQSKPSISTVNWVVIGTHVLLILTE